MHWLPRKKQKRLRSGELSGEGLRGGQMRSTIAGRARAAGRISSSACDGWTVGFGTGSRKSHQSGIASAKSPSILRLDVNVESYLDLHPIGVFYPDVASVDATLLVFPEALMSPRWFRSISMTRRLPSTTSNVTFSTGMTLAVIEARPSLRQSSTHPHRRLMGFARSRDKRRRGLGTGNAAENSHTPLSPDIPPPIGPQGQTS